MQVMKLKEQQVTVQVRLRTKAGDFLPFSITAYKFLNPYSEEFEYVVASHTHVSR